MSFTNKNNIFIRFKRFFEDPLLRPIEVYGTIFALLFVVYGFYESNRITWLNSINTTSLELSKMEIEYDYISCLYPSCPSQKVQASIGHDACKKIYDDSLNVKKATLYLEENLDFFQDIIEYDKNYHTNEFLEYYEKWYMNLYHETYNPIVNDFITEDINETIHAIDKFRKNHGSSWSDFFSRLF